MDILHPIVAKGILLILQIFTKVNGNVTYVALYRENRSICVENNNEIYDLSIKCATNICQNVLTKRNSHTITGAFFIDSDQTFDRNLAINSTTDCIKGCPSPTCNDENTTCNHQLKICCRYDENRAYSSNNGAITTACPSNFSISSCSYRHHLSYHECLVQIGQFIMTNSGRSFWTSSYIGVLDNVNEQTMKNLNMSITTQRKAGCFDHCLNLNSSQHVYYITFSSTKAEENCQCFTKDDAESHVKVQGLLYAVRNKTRDPGCISELQKEGCIAVVYRKSSVTYSIQNCSSQFAVICGPKPTLSQICNLTSTPSSDTNRKQDSPIYDERGDTSTGLTPTGDGMSSDSIIIVAPVVSLLVFVGLLCVFKYCYSQRKKGRQKHVERARPNSISNRTYHIQQSANTDEEDMYTSITETADALQIRRPLLPPRNNTRQDGHMMQEMEYSTPSDAIAKTIDVYTDTYDNPLRKEKLSPGDIVDPPGASQDTFDLTDVGHNKLLSSECEESVFKDTEINVSSTAALISNEELKASLNYESMRGAEGGCEIGRDVVREKSDSAHIANPYFTLTKQIDNTDVKNHMPHDACIAVTSAGDNTDYEDTSVINGNIGVDIFKPGFNAEQESCKDGNDETSLLCKLSPYLLKELNIRIVPDNNDYAVNVNLPRKSSSNINLWNVDLNDRDGNRQGIENAEPESDYDRLGYVERVMEVGRRANLYHHVILNTVKKESQKTSNRRGTI